MFEEKISQEFGLKDIDEKRNYFPELMIKKHEKV